MVTIYCIEDCNSLKYVGSTKQTLKQRLIEHRSHKRTNKTCSSRNLDLDNCKIYSLETCNQCDRSKKEKYWINQIECVNEHKLICDSKEHDKKYYQKNKIIMKERMLKYYKNNKEILKQRRKERYLFESKKVVNGCYEFIKMLEQY